MITLEIGGIPRQDRAGGDAHGNQKLRKGKQGSEGVKGRRAFFG